jgi:hypothetical protein
MRQPLFAAHLLEKYLHRDPENVEVLGIYQRSIRMLGTTMRASPLHNGAMT